MNSLFSSIIKSTRTILVLIMMISLTACFHRKEHEQFQRLATINSDSTRLKATREFIRQYPKSDSLQLAMESALRLWDKTGQNDQKRFFLLQYRLTLDNPKIRDFLDSALISILAADSAEIQQLTQRNKYYRKSYPDPLAPALLAFPHLNTGFQSDSLRNRILQTCAAAIIQSDYARVDTLKQFSDQILALQDYRLIPLSNRFLINGIAHNRQLMLPDSVRNQTYYTFYTALAWNAYRQQRYFYALNLISQASKYGNLDDQNGNIILGAAQAQCGELNAGWARILRGLILNTNAEKESTEINQIYTEMFQKIRGSRENPARFLNQYRRSHR